MATVEARPNNNYWHFLDVWDTGEVSGTERKIGIRFVVDVRVSGSAGSWPGPALFRATVDGENIDVNMGFDTRTGADLFPIDTTRWINVGSSGVEVSFYLTFSGWSSSFPAASSPVGYLWLEGVGNAPSPAGQPTFSEVTNNSVRVSWTAPTDDGGLPVQGYLLRSKTSSPVDVAPWTDHSVENNLSRVVTGLATGVPRYFAVYAYNASGYAPKSLESVVTPITGARVKDDGVWKQALSFVKVGGVWKQARPYVKQGGTWKPTS